ncbi:transposon-encoded TnpW family protein [Oscillospiraceae bacterium OttesenSCG-928-G22]|nr:transposon-encoded TnpW family protein [Oscillospiraceae bacterium OttesenSCG-928-G22]
MPYNNWRDYAKSRELPIETGRKLTELEKYPADLDFSKTIGGTTYEVNSHFSKDSAECMVAKVARLTLHGHK